MNKEEMIAKHMNVLGITREEAIQLIADDEEIDRMTRTSDIDGDLTAEQRKSAKKARQADRKPTVYKFDTTKRKRAENTGKRIVDGIDTGNTKFFFGLFTNAFGTQLGTQLGQHRILFCFG